MAAERRANVLARQPRTSSNPALTTEQHPDIGRAPGLRGGAKPVGYRTPQEPAPLRRPHSRPEPVDILPGDDHGCGSRDCWISLTTGQTGVGDPGRTGRSHRQRHV
jgi:hypothetical protein